MRKPFRPAAVCLFPILLLSACQTLRPSPVAEPVKIHGDEIVVAGQMFRIGTPVVLWTDPHGYDAYRVERRFAPFEESDWETSREAVPGLRTPNRYNLRRHGLTAEQIEMVRGGGWDLPMLQEVVDQFVYHYDATGTSMLCFEALHDIHGLSVHFMLDVDGVIYQTLDLKERAWHATTSNTRSIGIEIANIGAFGKDEESPLDEWYRREADGRTRLTVPERHDGGGVLTAGFVGRPARNEPVTGIIQGREVTQFDFTPEQYEALIKLTAALVEIFPKMTLDYPRSENGELIPHKLPDEQLEQYQGLIGHYHIQTNKIDPGPAFQWDRVLDGARERLRQGR